MTVNKNKATAPQPQFGNWIGIPLNDDSGEATGRRTEFGSARRPPNRSSRRDGPRPCVTINLEMLEAAGVLAPATSSSLLARTFRQLKLPLLAEVRGDLSGSKRRSVIAVTSALRGEGKTFCAINLALSIAAEVDLSVLLIQADSDHPDLPNRLGTTAGGLGLFDLLTQPELRVGDVTVQTNVPKLELLPCGTPNALPGELLASNAMKSLLLELTTSDQNQIVIIDAPSMIGNSAATALASQAGQVVLVVKASTTPRRAVLQALSALDHCDIVAPLLNKARMPMSPSLQLPLRSSVFDSSEPTFSSGR